jgi:hypothetical protein
MRIFTSEGVFIYAASRYLFFSAVNIFRDQFGLPPESEYANSALSKARNNEGARTLQITGKRASSAITSLHCCIFNFITNANFPLNRERGI